jgi:hypothetical protein
MMHLSSTIQRAEGTNLKWIFFQQLQALCTSYLPGPLLLQVLELEVRILHSARNNLDVLNPERYPIKPVLY